jgi:mRNA interferase RelE/StbE
LASLDKTVARRITEYLRIRIAPLDNPRAQGKALTGSSLGSLWRYRVGDYRIVCDLQDKALTILVIRIGNRREIYR